MRGIRERSLLGYERTTCMSTCECFARDGAMFEGLEYQHGRHATLLPHSYANKIYKPRCSLYQYSDQLCQQTTHNEMPYHPYIKPHIGKESICLID